MTWIFCPEKDESIPDKTAAEALFQQAVGFFNQYCYLDALPLFRQAASGGHPQALRYLGWFYENGYYVSQDMERAAACYRQASDHGDGLASGQLALMYDSVTIDFPTDYEEAFRLYSLALSRNAATDTALNNLAVLYLEGNGTEANLPMAETLFQRAIALGHPLAESNLAELRRRLTCLHPPKPFCPRCGAPAVPVFRHDSGGNTPMVCKTCGQLFQMK